MDPVSLLSSERAPTATRQPNAFSDLTSEQFVKIMFTELSKQDPLKPNDSAALLEQMASIRAIQSDMELTQKLEALVTQNQLASASGLIGRVVSGVSEMSERVFGVVVSVSRTADGPVLNLMNGARVPFAQLDEMADPALLSPPPSGGNNNTQE